jgi:heme exporter protein B
LRVEWRSRELLAGAFLASILAAAIGAVSLAPIPDRAPVVSAVLWISLSFGGTILLARSFVAEADRGTLPLLLTLPCDRGAVFLGKAVANGVVLLVTAAVVTPLVLVFLAASGAAAALGLEALGALAAVEALGLVGLAAAGTFLAALAAHSRSREALVPVLLLPVFLPILLATLPATTALLRGAALAAIEPYVTILAGYDVALGAIGWLLFDFAVEG